MPAFAKGEDEQAALVCSMAGVALNGAKVYYEEKHDKATFVKNIISDNILLGVFMFGPKSSTLSPRCRGQLF